MEIKAVSEWSTLAAATAVGKRAPALKHRQMRWSSHSRSQSRQFGRGFTI